MHDSKTKLYEMDSRHMDGKFLVIKIRQTQCLICCLAESVWQDCSSSDGLRQLLDPVRQPILFPKCGIQAFFRFFAAVFLVFVCCADT
jgi:hypothetical protein